MNKWRLLLIGVLLVGGGITGLGKLHRDYQISVQVAEERIKGLQQALAAQKADLEIGGHCTEPEMMCSATCMDKICDMIDSYCCEYVFDKFCADIEGFAC